MCILLVSVLAAIFGGFSAFYWWKSSKVIFSAQIDDVFINGKQPVVKEDIENFMKDVSYYNTRAALCSGLTALLAGVASVLSSASQFPAP